MSFLADLRIGTYGIQFIPPFSWRLEVDRDRFASFRDEAHRVDWHLEFYPLIVDLSIECEEMLEEDLRRDTTAVFESFFRSRESPECASTVAACAESTASPGVTVDRVPIHSLPRTTSDPTWSPVVSVERVWIGGAPALLVIHRLTYAVRDELIIGRIIIPLEQGTVYVSALQQAETTGMRETALSIVGERSPQDGDSEVSLISQAMIDDPALDEQFPDHPLSVIRRALQWVLTTPLKMTVRTPLVSQSQKSMILPRSGCSINPPPRFRFCPAMATTMNQSLTPFVRATVPQAGSYTFDVWRVPSVSVKGRQLVQQLRLIAEDSLRSWGPARDPTLEVECLEFSMRVGLPGLSTYLCFPLDGRLNHGVANWFADHDGTVFRICAAAAVSRSRDELTRMVNDSTATWERLPESRAPRSVWWKLFSS